MWAQLASSASAAAGDASAGAAAGGGYGDPEEIELGLSLASTRRCRILTASEFRPPPSARPSSSTSSVSSSSGGVEAAPLRKSAPPAPPAAASNANETDQRSCSPVVVGWPPIRVLRMNSLSTPAACPKKHDHANGTNEAIAHCAEGITKEPEPKKALSHSTFVKVNMDGDPIGRKVGLHAHGSYKSLISSLESMFMNGAAVTAGDPKPLKLFEDSSEYALTYEDKEGDWMLVGDVPWRMFVDTAKRLRIMRTSDASGIGSKR